MTKNKPILFIHIGCPKTGTTALQIFLKENRDILKKNFALYPESACRAGGHHDIAFLLHGQYPEWAIPQEKSLCDLWNSLEHEVRSYKGNLIISSENFYIFPEPKKLSELISQSHVFKDMTIKILVYLRPQEEIIPAWYNQTVKAQGTIESIEKSINRNLSLWDYSLQLKKWAEVFGKEHMIIRPYLGGSGIEWDIRQDFLSAFNISPDQLELAPLRVNSNLNRDILEFQRVVNNLPIPCSQKRLFHKELIDLTEKTNSLGLFDNAPLLSDESKLALRAFFSKSNAETSRMFFNEEDLFGEVKLEGDKFFPYPGLSNHSLACIFAWLITGKK